VNSPQLWVSAVALGSFFGLLGLSYYLVLIGAGFFNIAVGAYATLGGLTTAWLVVEKGMSLWPAVLIAMVGTTVVAGATEVLVVQPVQRRGQGGELPALVAVVAVLFAAEQFAGYLFGYTTLPGQQLINVSSFSLGSAVVSPNTAIMVVFTLVVFAVLAALVRVTSAGRLLRAVGDSNAVANLLGLPVRKVRIAAFLLSGLIAAAAGLLFAPQAGVSSASGLNWALDGFLALVIGGSGTIFAPLVGGLVLGGMQIFIPFYFGGSSLNYLLLALAVVFFAFRPQGVFAVRVRI
jgi:branched-chain amino acid transport system permease protein